MSDNEMEMLLSCLKDGHARTIGMLASELNTSQSDVTRRIEFLENMGLIKKVITETSLCGSCQGCSTGGKKACKSCQPEGGFKNMGQMWEVV